MFPDDTAHSKKVEEEERAKLLVHIAALEAELRGRIASNEADIRQDDEIVVDEVLDDLEATVLHRDVLKWDSDDEDAEDGDQMSSIVNFARKSANYLSAMTIVVQNDIETNFSTSNHNQSVSSLRNTTLRQEEKPREVMIAITHGMTFRTVIDFVCTYWGFIVDSDLRLVDDRGIWHRLDATVAGSIIPSRRKHPILYLQRREGLQSVLKSCEMGKLDEVSTSKKDAIDDIAPLLSTSMDTSFLALNQNHNAKVRDSEKDQVAEPVSTATSFAKLKSASFWKTDEILFTWRRVGCDFFLNVFMFITLCVFLTSIPKYTESSGVKRMVASSLVDVHFWSPPQLISPPPSNVSTSVSPKQLYSMEEISTWTDFWSWIDVPFTSVILKRYFFAEESVLSGPVRFRQNRVKAVPCTRPYFTAKPCYPDFSEDTELTEPTFAGTKFDTRGLRSISGVFANYPSHGYVVDILPKANLDNPTLCPQIAVTTTPTSCSVSSNSTCWSCIIQSLQQNQWLDDGTRYVSVQFLVYSANVDMYIDCTFGFEISSAGYISVTHKVRYISAEDLHSREETAFVTILSLLLAFIGVQFLQTAAYINSVWSQGKRLDPQIGSYFAFRTWLSLPTRFTILNPIIFILGIVGVKLVSESVETPTVTEETTVYDLTYMTVKSISSLHNGQIVLGVANLVVAFKLITYFEFTSRFLTYFQDVIENLLMLCAAMTLAVCSFAWLLTATASVTSFRGPSTFADNFILVVRLLMNQVSPSEFIEISQDNWFIYSWVFYASQIALNLVLVRIAVAICYHALSKEDSAAEHVFEQMKTLHKSTLKWLAS